MTDPDNPLRRDFLRGAGAAGFALAVQPVLAQQVISTPDAGLRTGVSTVAAMDGQTLPLFYARPDRSGRPPVVLVVSEIFGVHEHVRDICRRFAHAGYLAVAPELFFRQGDPSAMDNVQQILERVIARVPDAQVMADLDRCVDWAQGEGGDVARLHVTGYCWGGRITWLYAAHRPSLRSGVAWYGRLRGNASTLTPTHPLDLTEKLQAPVLGLYGGQDAGIPNADVEAMNAALAASASPAARGSHIVLYPDAQHAFHADYRPSYRAADAADAWRRCLEWMNGRGGA
ncbi:MAG: dienelactone hydrolase family protein [Methyloversatilis sp.]|nr:dienelactone hydrolase family protein [Methyloversatilis sp.]